MKRGWKVFWIVCAITAGIGLMCCIMAKVLGVTRAAIENRLPWGIGIVRDYEYDKDEWKDAAEIEEDREQRFTGVASLDADVLAGELNIYTSQELSDEILLKTEDIDRRLKLKYYMDGDELKIKTTWKLFHLNHSSDAGKINIYIPENYRLEEFSAEVKAGTFYVENIEADEFSVEVGAGEAEVEHFTAGEADFECGTGSIQVYGRAEREADINCGVGEIMYTVPGKESDFDYEVSCGIGEVVCGASSYSGLGNSREIDNRAGRQMKIECGIGSVIIDFTDEL